MVLKLEGDHMQYVMYDEEIGFEVVVGEICSGIRHQAVSPHPA